LRQIGRICFAALALGCALSACTVQLVAPYNSELAQRASSMQAEVVAWDLRMRDGAGTITNDPRHPDVTATLNKWRGEAEAMLTLAIANDPGTVNCSAVLKTVAGTIERSLPAEVLLAPLSSAQSRAASSSGSCEAALVATAITGIDDIERALKYCRTEWVDDAYFTELAANRFTTTKPPKAQTPTAQDTVRRACFSEFRPSLSSGTAAMRHGRAVSALMTTLQSVVYVENRKRAALAK